MQPYTIPPEEGWRLGPGPFVFHGRPPFCYGELELINDTSERLKVRALPTEAEGAAQELFGNLRLAGRLQPGERRRVRGYLQLDPATPPGTYEVDLVVGGRRERITAHVFEQQAVTVSPRPLRLRGAPGEALTHTIVVANHGNLPRTVPEVVLVHFEERDWLGRSLAFALREQGVEAGYQALLDRTVREMRSTDIPPTRALVRTEQPVVEPGETVVATLELTAPDKLTKGRTYVRTIPFMTSTLRIQLECNGSANSNKRRPA